MAGMRILLPLMLCPWGNLLSLSGGQLPPVQDKGSVNILWQLEPHPCMWSSFPYGDTALRAFSAASDLEPQNKWAPSLTPARPPPPQTTSVPISDTATTQTCFKASHQAEGFWIWECAFKGLSLFCCNLSRVLASGLRGLKESASISGNQGRKKNSGRQVPACRQRCKWRRANLGCLDPQAVPLLKSASSTSSLRTTLQGPWHSSQWATGRRAAVCVE